MEIAGILNVTEDSFSDGGMYNSYEKAIERCEQLISDGADVIDLGVQSSNIHSVQIDPVQEWETLEPIVEYLQKKDFLYLG